MCPSISPASYPLEGPGIALRAAWLHGEEKESPLSPGELDQGQRAAPGEELCPSVGQSDTCGPGEDSR